MFTLALTVIPAEAGIQRLVGLDSRLRGNDKGVGFVHTYYGSIFVAMPKLYLRCIDTHNRLAVMCHQCSGQAH